MSVLALRISVIPAEAGLRLIENPVFPLVLDYPVKPDNDKKEFTLNNFLTIGKILCKAFILNLLCISKCIIYTTIRIYLHYF
jgi:hypothetical protein